MGCIWFGIEAGSVGAHETGADAQQDLSVFDAERSSFGPKQSKAPMCHGEATELFGELERATAACIWTAVEDHSWSHEPLQRKAVKSGALREEVAWRVHMSARM